MKGSNKIALLCFSLLLSAFISFSQNVDSLQRLLRKANQDTVRLDLLLQLVENINDDNVWPKYNELAYNLAEKLAKNDNKTIREIGKKALGETLSNIGLNYQNKGDYSKAISCFYRSLKIQEEVDDKKGIANSLNSIGINFKNQGDMHKALEYFLKSLKILEEGGFKMEMANILNSIGFSYFELGDIQKTIDYLGRCMKIQEEFKDKKGIALSLNNIAVIYHNQGDIPKAMECLNKSLKIRREIGDIAGEANSLMNLGFFLSKQKNDTTILHYYNQGLKLHEQVGNKAGIANALLYIGYFLQSKKEFDKSLACYDRSLKIYRQMESRCGIAEVYVNIGSVYNMQKKFALAYISVDSSLIISKRLGLVEKIKNAERLLSKIDSASGNIKGAFDHYKQYIIFRDSISNVATRKASIKNELKYEFDKKEMAMKEQQEMERTLAGEKSRFQKVVIWSVVAGLLIVIIFSTFIFRSLQQNKKANKIITLQKQEVEKQKELVDTKNHIIEEKQKEIIDSINYAKRIQYTLLAHDNFLKDNISDHFIYFNPKDIVSGDFYWATKKNNKFYLAVCDSTGHGVPGAFMSLLNIGFLSEAINEKNISEPNMVLNYVRQRLIDNISKDGQRDGFDGILICIDSKTKKISYSAANNSPIKIANNLIVELESDRMPVGIGERKDEFKLFKIDLKVGETLYLYTDGYADQFGGPKGKKFKYKQLNELLLANSSKNLMEQKNILAETFESWRGKLEQIDDVCIIAIRV